MSNLGKRLNQHKFEELVRCTDLETLTLDEIIDIAINGNGMNYISNGNNFWEFAGVYYRFTGLSRFVILIDREQMVGGYNNSEIVLVVKDKNISSNDKRFLALVKAKINEKSNTINKNSI